MKNRSHFSFLFILFCIGLSVSCRKLVEDKKQQIARSFITDGTWRVSRYQAGDSNVTVDFNGYIFQFLENGLVAGSRAADTITGTWSVDLAAHTILSSFPGDPVPLGRLNHTWKITDSYNDSVSANSNEDSVLLRLELHKN